MANDYKEKIRKLLSLAESPNEHEARAALLKARQLMAEHKLCEADLRDVEKAKVRKELTDLTCSKRRDSWMVTLSAVIAENYCCQAYRERAIGKQTVTIGFIGLEDDYEICETVFRYAVDCVRSRNKEYRKQHDRIYTGRYIRRVCEAYGKGFSSGVNSMYERQNEKNKEWGLVLAVPQEVLDESRGMKRRAFEKPFDVDEAGLAEISAEIAGRHDGEEFDPARRIGECS